MQRVNVLGVGVSEVNMATALEEIHRWIEVQERHYICVTGVHGVIESQRDSALKTIHNQAGMVTPDGMPLVWISRLTGRDQVDRVYGPDLMLALCQESLSHGYRHYFYGGGHGIPDLLAERLSQRFPGLQIAGTFSPPFRPLTPEEEQQVVATINQSESDIVWVGLSTPKQERWMAAHRSSLQAPVLIGVGAAFDFHAGLKPQAPTWMRRAGLEWLYRLLSEPRRLGPRYLINNPLFLLLIAAQGLGLKQYPLE